MRVRVPPSAPQYSRPAADIIVELIITAIHVITCLLLIVVILLQSGTAGDLASAFGGMGSQTAFGPRGAQTTLSKTTIVLAIIFGLTTVTLAVISNRSQAHASSILGSSAQQHSQPSVPAKK